MSRACAIALVLALSCEGSVSAGTLIGPITNPANGRHYYLLSEAIWSPEGFAASEEEAVKLRGHLATINDAGEDRWVYETFSPFLPMGSGVLGIGLNDLVSEGDYVWTSGENSLHRNWDPNWHDWIGPNPTGRGTM